MTTWIRSLAARFRRKAGTVPEPGGTAFIVVTLAVVALVAIIAFAASYQHQYELSIYYRQTHWVAGMMPFSVDLLIVAAGLVIWYAARHGYPRPLRAYAALAAGVAATVIANLAADHHYAWPWLGPGISVWPAIAFVGAYEMAIWLVRKRQETAATPKDGDTVSSPVAGDAETAAAASLRVTLAAGNPWSQNQLQEQFRLTRAQASKVRQRVLAGSNGHDTGSAT
jgi:Protein of unknown function (DUF2637)